MTREEQILNGFTEMMKGFWENQDLEVPDFEEHCKQEPCDNVISRLIVQEEISKSIALKENSHQMYKRIQAIPSVTPKFTDAEIQSNDCISRQAVIEVLNKMDRYVADELTLCDTEKKFPKNEVFIVDDIYEQIAEQLPSVTPQPKTGHWKDIMVGDMPAQACDRCNTFYPLAYTGGGHKYCPNCGTKMEVSENEW